MKYKRINSIVKKGMRGGHRRPERRTVTCWSNEESKRAPAAHIIGPIPSRSPQWCVARRSSVEVSSRAGAGHSSQPEEAGRWRHMWVVQWCALASPSKVLSVHIRYSLNMPGECLWNLKLICSTDQLMQVVWLLLRQLRVMLSSIAFIRSPTVAPWSTTIAEGKKGVIQLCVSVYVT